MRPNPALQYGSGSFRQLVESVRDNALFMLDRDGYVITWNPGAERLKGYEGGEIIGKHFSVFYTEDDRKRNHPQSELDRAIAEGRYEEEGWRVRKDGSRFWAKVVITALYDDRGMCFTPRAPLPASLPGRSKLRICICPSTGRSRVG